MVNANAITETDRKLAAECCAAYLAGDLDSVVRLTAARVANAAGTYTASTDATIAPVKRAA